MTSPPEIAWRGRVGSSRLRTLHVDLFALMALVGALMIAVSLVLGVIRLSGGGGPSFRAAARAPAVSYAPVAMPANGEYVRTRVLPSGDLAVDHWVQSTNHIWQLVLTVPDALRSGGKDVVASRVRVFSDGVEQAGPTTVRAKETYHAQGASTMHVSYVLSGAVVRGGTTPHRALLRTTSLNLAYPLDRGPRVVSVTGARVLAAACTPPGDASTASAQPCGSAQGQGWEIRLQPDARRDGVRAQLDLT